MQPASAAGVLMRIDGDTAAANCVCKESMPKPHLRPANGGQADFAAAGKPARSVAVRNIDCQPKT